MSKIRNIAFALIFLLLFQTVAGILQPDKVYASGDFAGGTGTMEDPFLISNATELDAVRNYTESGSYFKLTADLDLSSYADDYGGLGWLPIATDSTKFNGSMDGDGHTITGLMMNRPTEDYLGLFAGAGSSSSFTNMKLVDVHITGREGVGGLVGDNEATITNSYVTGSVAGTDYVGGLAGFNYGPISNSYAAVDVSGTDYIGGLVGEGNGSISNSYATGDVTGNERIGGLAGSIYLSSISISISSSYATGKVTGITNVGGLVGYYGGGTINNSYYDKDTTVQSDTGKGEPKITADMKNQSTYSDWDFINEWGINPARNDGYPYLRVFYQVPSLQVTSAPGNTLNTIKVTAQAGAGNHLVVQVSDSNMSAPEPGDAVPVSTEGGVTNPYTSASYIGGVDATTNKYVAIYEADSEDNVVKFKLITLTISDIQPFAGGTGERDNPFLIQNANGLDAVRYDLEAHFKLTADIDLSSYADDYGDLGWLPIGNSKTPFNGSIDGDGHTITGLTMNRPAENHLGLFGVSDSSSSFTNMRLAGVNIIGSAGVGGLAGNTAGTISNSFVTGIVQGGIVVGGLAGYNLTGEITNSYATVNVTGGSLVGGLVGMNIGNVNSSYATGSVIGTGTYAGGLAGHNNGGTINNSYATGSVRGSDTVGGLIGSNSGTINNSYATGSVTGTAVPFTDVGGFAGSNSGSINSSYYDQVTTNQVDNTGKGEPKTTTEMKNQGSYSLDWDFSNIWGIDSAENDGYPYIRALRIPSSSVLQSALAGDRQVKLSWSAVDGSTGYKIFKSTTSGTYGAAEMTVRDAVYSFDTSVSASVYSIDVTGLTNGTIYYFTMKATNAGGDSAASNEVSATPKTVPGAPTAITATAGNGQASISFTAPEDDGGSPITSYEVTASPGNITVTGTTSPITITGLSNGTAYTFTAEALNSAGSSMASATSNAVTPSSPVSTQPNNDTSDTPDTQDTPSAPTVPTDTTTIDLGSNNVGAKLQVKADVQTSANGTTSSKVTLDTEQLTESLASLNDKDAAAKTVTIAIEGDAQEVNVDLPVAAIMNATASDTQGTIIIQAGTVSYDIPLSLLKQLSENFPEGNILITINKISGELGNSVIDKAAASQVSLLLDNPIEFKITAGDQEITEFGGTYVERTVNVDQPVDPSTSTAVWYDPITGTFRFVPSIVTETNGTTQVMMKSPHNSMYTIIQSDKSFDDITQHWAKKDIEMLASKLIVNGVTETSFAPESKISRAEFVALLVRSLGLTVNTNLSSFKDIKVSDWYAGDVEAAVKAGLIKGFADGAFQPNSEITREQMAAMIASAMKFVGKDPVLLTSDSEELLDRFTDADKIQTWAKEAVAQSVKAGIVNGRTDATFAPGADATRAEAVSMLRRMLQYIEFIN